MDFGFDIHAVDFSDKPADWRKRLKDDKPDYDDYAPTEDWVVAMLGFDPDDEFTVEEGGKKELTEWLTKGGSGSGNFNHAGRPGEVGGSGSVFHGTMEEFGDKIAKEGLKPSTSASSSEYGIGVYASRDKYNALAYAYARSGIETSDNPDAKIALVVCDKGAFKRTDEPTFVISREGKAVPPEKIQSVEFYDKKTCDEYFKIADAVVADWESKHPDKDLSEIPPKLINDIPIGAPVKTIIPSELKKSAEDVVYHAVVFIDKPKKEKGGSGSGNFSHSGREGQVGGSSKSDLTKASTDKEIGEHFANTIKSFLPKGDYTVTPRVSREKGVLRIGIEVQKGTFSPRKGLDAELYVQIAKGKQDVYHESYYVKENLRGLGISTSFMKEAEKYGELLGCKTSSLLAIQDGRYVWPKIGFKLSDKTRYTKIVKYAKESGITINSEKDFYLLKEQFKTEPMPVLSNSIYMTKPIGKFTKGWENLGL